MPLTFNEYKLLAERNPFELSLFDRLKPYANNPSYFVTFTSIEKVGINPTNAFSTPIGVYAYSLKDLWKLWIAGNFFFGRDRPYVNLLKVNTTKILHLKEYIFTNKDLAVLKREYESGIKPGEPSFDQFLANARTETAADKNLYSNKSDGAVLWHCTFKIARMKAGAATKSFTVKWNSLFRDLGYDAIYDNTSIIHLLQSSQAVFFTPTSYKVVGRFPNKNLIANDSEHWGTKEQPFWHPGENPAIDIIVRATLDGETRVLLIKRKDDLNWALPGGFVQTDAKKGEEFSWGRETPKQAAVRVLTEETKLYAGNIRGIGGRVKFVGKFDSRSRDPRNNKDAWSASYLFEIELTSADNIDFNKVGGQAGTLEAKWFPIKNVPKLAFDHNALINKVV